MQRPLVITALLLLAAALLTAPALAADRDTCTNSSGDAATAACSRVIASGTFKGHDLADIYVKRGLLREDKDSDGAIADYGQAVRADPTWAVPYFFRGNLHKSHGDLDAALPDYNQAIRLDPKSAMGYAARGSALLARGDFDGAIADLDQAITRDPKNARVYNDRGFARYDRSDFNGAIADFNQAIVSIRSIPCAYSNRATALRRFSRASLRPQLRTTAVQFSSTPKMPMPIFAAVFTRMDLGDIDGAFGDCNRALQSRSDEPLHV